MELPTGTVTFLFTDIEGSTRLLKELGDAYIEAQDLHDRILRAAIDKGGGTVVRTEGDSFFAAFPTASGAVEAAVGVQRELSSAPWPEGRSIKVRMGMHTGEGKLGGDSYVGISVVQAARISAAGHGDQILLSDATLSLVQDSLPSGVSARDLGKHRLKDIESPVVLYDLTIEGLASDFPSPNTLSSRPNNLPAPLTSFVGRSEEVHAIAAALDKDRLVTLTGPGGTGKTRLAIEVGTDMLPRFDDGVFMVDLAPITDLDLVPNTVANALKVRDDPHVSVMEGLTSRLEGQSSLIVLDNFEQVVDAASTVSELLRASPELRILVTSRVPLRLQGEREIAISPMDTTSSKESQETPEAISLFIDRAQLRRSDFQPDEAAMEIITKICERVDGLPLGVEIAASRIKFLSPDQILKGLEESPERFHADDRSTPERHRSLAAAVEWSLHLLGPDERKVFERLSIFPSTADIEAIEAIIDPEGDIEAPILEIMSSLVDHSLVVTVPSPEPRFRMLVTIREIASRHLGDQTSDLAQRHAHYFANLAQQARPHFTGESQSEWLARCERDHENFRAALRWAIDSGDVAIARIIGGSLWRFWQLLGFTQEGSDAIEEILEMSTEVTPDLFDVHIAAGSLSYWQQDMEGAASHYERAREIADEFNDENQLLIAEYNLAWMPLVSSRDTEVAIELFQRCIDKAVELDNIEMEAECRGAMVYCYVETADLDAALKAQKEAIEAAKKAGNQFWITNNSLGLGELYRQIGEPATSAKHFLEGLEQLIEAGNLALTVTTIQSAAGLAIENDRPFEGIKLNVAGERLSEIYRSWAPNLFRRLGDVEEAKQALSEAEVTQALAEAETLELEDVIELTQQVFTEISLMGN